MKNRKDPRLEHRTKIDQDIATADEIELREGGVLRDILPGDDTEFTHVFIDLVIRTLFREELPQPLGRDRRTNLFRIQACAGIADDPFTHVGGKQLDRSG